MKPVSCRHRPPQPVLAAVALFASLLWSGPTALRCATAQTASSSTSSAPAPASAPELKADLRRILSDREFGPESKDVNPLTRLIQNLREYWDRVRKWFRDLFSVSGLSGGGTALTWTLVLLMAAALLWIAYRLLRDWKPRPRSAPAPRGAWGLQEPAPSDIVRDPEHWRREAEENARAGRYRPAYRALFLALLLTLDQAGILAYDRARTNGDYIRALRAGARAALYETLLPPANAFDRFWYGQEPVTVGDYQALLGIYHRLPALMASLPAPASAPDAAGQETPSNAPGDTGASAT